MGTLTTQIRKEVMDHACKLATMPQADSFVFRLLRTNPTPNADGTNQVELTGLGYAPKEIAMSADPGVNPFTVSASGVMSNESSIQWDAAATGDWDPVVGVMIMRKVAGVETRFAVASVSLTVTTGQTPMIQANQLSVQLAAGTIA